MKSRARHSQPYSALPLLVFGLAITLTSTMGCDDDTGNVDDPGGATGASGAPTSGDSHGGIANAAAGSGGDSAGAASAAGGQAGPASTCGDGVTEPGECEPPSSSLCTDDCVEIATSACYDCEQSSACYEFSESCLVFEGDERALCYDVHECVQETGCADGEDTLTSCFCGDLQTSECIEGPSSGTGSPMGPCAEIIRRSMGGDGTTNSQVLTRYSNVMYPGGAAIARMTCDKYVMECLAPCGF